MHFMHPRKLRNFGLLIREELFKEVMYPATAVFCAYDKGERIALMYHAAESPNPCPAEGHHSGGFQGSAYCIIVAARTDHPHRQAVQQ